MRPDVKLGSVVSMVMVLVAGGYYLYRDKSENAIPVIGDIGIASVPNDANDITPIEATPDSEERPEPSYLPDRMETPNVASGGSEQLAQRAFPLRLSPDPETLDPGEDSRQVEPVSGVERTGTLARGSGSADSAPLAGSGTDPAAGSADLAERAETKGPGDSDDSTGTPSAARLAQKANDPETRSPRRSERRQVRVQRSVPLVATRAGVSGGAAPSGSAGGLEVAVETHRVQLGDTLSSLSQDYYGSVRYTRFLIDSNPQIRNPDRLDVGMLVKIPPRPSDAAVPRARVVDSERRRATAGGETHRVRPGESFYSIARDVLGDASRYSELMELNKELVHGDPTRLQVGQIITLPKR